MKIIQKFFFSVLLLIELKIGFAVPAKFFLTPDSSSSSLSSIESSSNSDNPISSSPPTSISIIITSPEQRSADKQKIGLKAVIPALDQELSSGPAFNPK